MTNANEPIRVMVVDDSAFARLAITKQLSSDAEIEVVGTARDGVDALSRIKALRPDVVTMDVAMPQMDGLAALERIMAECPTPVVMLSSLTGEGTDTAVRALQIGAIDVFLKPSLANPAGDSEMASDLLQKIKDAARVNISQLKTMSRSSLTLIDKDKTRTRRVLRTMSRFMSDKVVIIGSSTGGPRALYEIIPELPGNVPASFLIVQHMPPKFTKSLADRLDQISELGVKEAENGDGVMVGSCLLAPGGYHMEIGMNGKINLNQDAPRGGLRPAVDVTMAAAARVYGSRCLGVILTGMGNDGTLGAAMVKAAGGRIIVQDESTCVVYGMPKSVVDSGFADKIVPLHQIAQEVVAVCNQTNRASMKV